MSLTTPSSVQKLQTALHAKAKEAPKFRFLALYDKVYRRDVLAYAYECCRADGGSAGVLVLEPIFEADLITKSMKREGLGPSGPEAFR